MKTFKEIKKISGSEVVRKLNPHLLQFVTIEDEMETIKVNPFNLLGSNRFDVMAKYIYAKFRDLGINSNWAKDLYDEHIRIFNNYEEGDQSGKKGIADFINAFDSILDSIKNNGFDDSISLMPLGANNEPIEGSHRLAACLLYNKDVVAVKFDNKQFNYNYEYFLEKGLARKWCDAIALEYCKLKSNTYIIIVYPSAVGKNNRIKEILNHYGKVFYEKNIYFKNPGPKNLIIQIYHKEKWLGDLSNNYSGAINKMKPCFQNNDLVRVFVLETDNLKNVNNAKEEIRNLFGIGNHSVHINDSHQQTIQLAQIFFNDNSIHFLNSMQINKNRKFHKLFDQYKNWLDSIGFDKEYFCVDTSAVMAAYGIREPRDFDFLHYGYDNVLSVNEKIASHNDELKYHVKTKDDIIFNPENHFYYGGMKFASLDIIKEMKRKRGETKDLDDIELINSFLDSKQRAISTKMLQLKIKIKNKLLILRSKGLLKRIFKKLYRESFRFIDNYRPFIQTINYMGFNVYYSRGTSLIQQVRESGFYEKEVCDTIVNELTKVENPVFLDIGANIGLISLYILNKIPNTRIYAFEPGPHQNQLLTKTILTNKLTKNIVLDNNALSYKTGKANFAVHDSKDVSGDGFFDTGRAGEVNFVEVPVTTIDEWWKNTGYPSVNVVKIDAEGAELWILEGGGNMLNKNRPILFIEIWNKNLTKYPYDAKSILDKLSSMNYSLYTLNGDHIINDKDIERYPFEISNFVAYPKIKES